MQNLGLISLAVSKIDAVKETYRGAILCIFLPVYDFSEILDGCKFCIIKDRNFKFSGMLIYLYAAVHREKNT